MPQVALHRSLVARAIVAFLLGSGIAEEGIALEWSSAIRSGFWLQLRLAICVRGQSSWNVNVQNLRAAHT